MQPLEEFYSDSRRRDSREVRFGSGWSVIRGWQDHVNDAGGLEWLRSALARADGSSD